MPLAVRSKTFYPPAGAARAEIYLRLYDHRQEMKIYNVSLSPEPYRAGVRSPEEILRNAPKDEAEAPAPEAGQGDDPQQPEE